MVLTQSLKYLLIGLLLLGHSALAQHPMQVSNEPAARYNQIIQGINTYQLRAIWHMYPSRYQADIKALIAGYSQLLDRDVYNRLAKSIKRLPAVLKKKKQLIYQSIVIMRRNTHLRKTPTKRFQVRFNQIFDGYVELITQVSKSDLSRHRQLRQPDVERFFSRHGGPILKAIEKISPRISKRLKRMQKSKATTISNNGQIAKVHIDFANGKQRNMRMVKVQNRWMIKRFASRWERMTRRLHEKLRKAQSNRAAINLNFAISAGLVEGIVTQLDQAKTTDEVIAAMTVVQRYLVH